MKNKEKWKRLITGLIIIICIMIVWGFYAPFKNKQPWANWTGFETKTLWDFMDLLIVPGILAGGTLWFNYQRNKTEREINKDRSLDSALQTYIDDMAGYLLERNLRRSEAGSDISELARTKTLTILQGLDGKRKGILIRFLYQSKLIIKDNLVLDLSGADLADILLSGNDEYGNRDRTFISYLSLANVQLSGTNLRHADFKEAKLCDARLLMADLSDANLTGAHLMFADLRLTTLTNTNITNANLMGANLSGAIGITNKQLAKAKSLKGATLPDGSKHE